MRRRNAVGLAGAVAVALGVWLWGPTDERTELVLHHRYGSVTEGSKLGVAIGADWRDADRALRRRVRPAYVLWQAGTPEELSRGGGRSSDTPILSGESEVSYRDRTWRNGVITLKLREGKVMEIVWHYAGPFYIDL